MSFSKHWLIELDHSSMGEISIYRRDRFSPEKVRLIKTLGDIYEFGKRDYFHRNFTFKVDPNVDYLIRFRTQSSFKIPLIVWDEYEFYKKSIIEYVLFFIFYGILLAFIFYNFILSLFTSEKKYIYYSFFLLTFFLTHFSVDGLAFQFFWPNSPEIKKQASLFFLGTYCFTFVFYCRNYLEKLSNRFFLIIDYLFYTFSLIFLIAIPFYKYQFLLGLGFLLLIFVSVGMLVRSISAMKAGIGLSGLLTCSCTAELLAILTYILKSKNLIPLNLFTAHSTKFLYMSQFTILSIGISESIKTNIKKSFFFDGISDSITRAEHEINKIFSKMKILLRAIEDKNNLEGKIRDKVIRIDRDIVKIKHIFDGLKSLGKRQKKDVNFSLKKALVEAIHSINNSNVKIFSKVPLHFDLDCLSHDVIGDEKAIAIVIENLIENALEDTKSKTEFYIEAKEVKKYAYLSIKNTNGYIPPRDLRLIFNPGVTSKPNGFGFGLAICKEIVIKHGGIIFATSSSREKTVEFKLSLPRSKFQSVDKVDLPKYIESTNLGRENRYDEMEHYIVNYSGVCKVLLVEDDIDFVEDFEKIAAELQFPIDLHLAKNSSEAYLIVDQKSPDIIFLDIDLGIDSQSGLEICATLKHQFVILLSNRSLETVPAFCREFIAKPILKINLIKIFNDFIRHQELIDRQPAIGKFLRLAFIEDDLEYVEQFCRLLSNYGYLHNYEVFEDPDELVDNIENNNRYDLIVVDRYIGSNDLLDGKIPELIRDYGFTGKVILYSNSEVTDFLSHGYDCFLSKDAETAPHILKELLE